ncbi:MAG TPA: hypothetical protein VLI41_08130 [Phenylobacterium sp.]|uniref:hypothetical protein n=1 Tax=Phenylobacterium sp. TaxID=1871053 RepID=UPI002BAF4754|nr:hypothetical protein [Phenylobacterium sp.]HSV03159.1 hypothetical protein [Phenylobacterium sp.]
MSQIVIGRQFRGPPNSGNGGYVCGVLGREIAGPATAVLRAPVPLDQPLRFERRDGSVLISNAEGQLIGKGDPAPDAKLPEPPVRPSLAAARAAGQRYAGLVQGFHPICFTCGAGRGEGDGLRVFTGQLADAAKGVVAGIWTPHQAFAEPDGLISLEVIWAALDCPGFFAWVEREGRHGALLGTMTAEVLRRPAPAEALIVLAWPIAREGRKETAGVALLGADGELLARAHQIWVVMGPRPPAPAPIAAAEAS